MNTYSTTVKELFDLQRFAIKLGLNNIRFLCNLLDNPQTAFPSIHIAGTNGKGSTSFYIARFLQAMGLRSGLFTSPHLADFRERIQVNGKKIPREQIIHFWQQTKDSVLQRRATFFDTTTALAFEHFRQEKVDVAVIETGLGGRLDSTNIVLPQIAVLTPINFDHQKQLGHTLSSITAEKAGIIKRDSVVFSAQQEDEVLKTIKEYLKPAKAFYYLPDLVHYTIRRRSLKSTEFDLFDKYRNLSFTSIQTRQVADFQVANIALAYQIIRFYLETLQRPFSEEKFREVLLKQLWPGRLQLIREHPTVIFDVSHNIHGIRNSLKFLSGLVKKQNLTIMVGLVDDKNYSLIAEEIERYASRIIVTEPETKRRLPGEKLIQAFTPRRNVKLIKELHKAYDFSFNMLQRDEILLIIGSHYLIGPLMNDKLFDKAF